MFICSECEHKSIKWLGKCPGCGSWESFLERKDSKENGDPLEFLDKVPPRLLKDIKQTKGLRISCHIDEFDRILGGGLVKGEVILVGGAPGIGKSTLLFQVAAALTKTNRVLYVSAEESQQQVSMRAQRLGIDTDSLYVLNEDNLLEVYNYIKQYKFSVVIIDSIQVVYNPRLQTSRGSPNQVRGCAEFLMRLAKHEDITFFIVGHVTKEGVIAGPKLLEHIVDCVLYFEPETVSDYKILRATKNRFGPTGEIAVFEMTSRGLKEVKSLSDLFLPHKDKSIAGSCTGCVIEGSKPMLIELQALASKTSFGMARRRSSGFDFNRFSLLVATLEKRLRISLASQDIFLSVAGGIKIVDPAADLAAILAIYSSFKEKELEENTVFIGEVGLVGELRPVSNISLRLKEVAKAGFAKCFIPEGNLKEIANGINSFKVIGLSSVKEVIERAGRVKS